MPDVAWTNYSLPVPTGNYDKSIWDDDLVPGDVVRFTTHAGNEVIGKVVSIDETNPCLLKIQHKGEVGTYTYARVSTAIADNDSPFMAANPPPRQPPRYSPKEIIERFTEGR